MIDEFQDIDQLAVRADAGAVRLPQESVHRRRPGPDHLHLARAPTCSICWTLTRSFPGTKTILMMENYRSAPEILCCRKFPDRKNADSHQKGPAAHAALRRVRSSATIAQTQRDGGRLDRGADEGASRGGHAIPGHDGALPRALCDAGGGGSSAGGEDPLHDLQRRPVLRPYGNQGRPLVILRMIAYQDDLSFLRIVNVAQAEPWRSGAWHFCRSTPQQAGPLACIEALQAESGRTHFSQDAGAGRFVSPDRVLCRRICQDARFPRCCPPSSMRAAMRRMLRTEGSQERLDNLAELKQSVYEYETTCGEECHPGALSGPCGSVHQCRHGGAGRQGEADDRPRRQGPGIPLCVPMRHE